MVSCKRVNGVACLDNYRSTYHAYLIFLTYQYMYMTLISFTEPDVACCVPTRLKVLVNVII